MPGDQPIQTEVIPVNGWVMEIDSGENNLRSPHFHQLSGLNKKTGTIEVVDGGTNQKIFFSDGILEHGPVTITRSRDGSVDDQAFANFVKEVFASGSKRSGTLVQYRHSKEVLQIRFKGWLFNDYSLADFDTHGSDKSDQSYSATVDFWEDEHKAL